MTREKQIEEFANSQVDCEFFDDSLYKGIIIGAKWDDKNSQMRKDYEFMLKKQELIKKACEWLKKELTDNRDNFGYPVVSTFDTITLNEFVEEFRKAMEE